MKIENYAVCNFKGVDYYHEANIQKRTIFVGPNGSGKSSLMEAIRYGITGDCPSNAIRANAPFASVEISLDKLAPIERKQHNGKASQIRYSGTLTTQKSVAEQIQQTFNINVDTIKNITSGEILRAMSAGELSKFLTESGLLPLSVDVEEIITECKLSNEAATMIRPFLPPMPFKFGLDEINECYENFFDLRKSISRDLKGEEIKAAAYTGPTPTRTIADVDKILTSLSSVSADMAIYQNAKKIYDEAKIRFDRQQAEIKRVEEYLSKNMCKIPDETKKSNAESQLRSLATREATARGTVSVLEKNLKMLEKMLSDLKSPKCPLSDKLVCTTDKTAIKDELEETIKSTKEELEKNKTMINDIIQKMDMFNKQIAEYDRDMDKYLRLQSESERLKALRAAIVPLPPVPVEPKNAAIDTAEIDKLNKEKSNIIAFNLAEEAKKKVVELENSKKIVQELVSALDPKGGIRESVIAYALTPLVDYCNARSKQMNLDIEIDIKAASGSRIYCKTPSSGGAFVPLESASSGQKAIIMFLVMDMLNSLSGLGILFLDGLEVLDKAAFDALLKILETPESEKTYDHIFMSAVDHDDTKSAIQNHLSSLHVVSMTPPPAPATASAATI